MEENPSELLEKVMSHVNVKIETTNDESDLSEPQNKSIPLDQSSFQCSVCDNFFPTAGHLINHMRVHINDLSTTSENSLAPSVNPAKQYKCPICNIICNSNDELLKHIHVHKYGNTSVKSYRKNVYSYVSVNKNSNNKGPVMIHKNEYPETESQNQVNSSNKSSLETNKSTSENSVTEKKNYKCPICHIVYYSNDDLLEHIHVHKFGNQSIHNNRQRIDNIGKYRCPICRLVYETNDELLKHVYIHKYGKEEDVVENNEQHDILPQSEKKLYKCPICHIICSGNNDLTMHIQNHVKITKYKCIYCGKGFERPSALEIHTRTHTKEKPFQCSVCDRFFSSAGQLVKHMKGHIPDDLSSNETILDTSVIENKSINCTTLCTNDGMFNTNVNSKTVIDYSYLYNEKAISMRNISQEILHYNDIALDTVQNNVNDDSMNSDIIEKVSIQNIDNDAQKDHSHRCDNEESMNLNIKQEMLSDDEGNFVFFKESSFGDSNHTVKIENQEPNVCNKDNFETTPSRQLEDDTKNDKTNCLTPELDKSENMTLANIKQEDTSNQLLKTIKQEDTNDKSTYIEEGLTNDGSVKQGLNANQNIDVIIKDDLEETVEHEELFSMNQESDPLSWHESDLDAKFSLTQDCFVCHLCPIVLQNKDDLEEHIKQHTLETEHSDKLEEMEDYTSNNDPSNYSIFVCSLCQLRFNFKRELKDHVIEQHGVIDTTRCPMCWKRFKDITVLVKHLFIHTYDEKGKKKRKAVLNNEVDVNALCAKTYKCPLCSVIFNTNDELLTHVTQHKKAIQKKCKYKCEYCGLGYEKPSQLKVHMRKHTREKTFICPKDCGESFMYGVQLRKHIITSHQYKCPLCSEVLDTNDELLNHITEHKNSNSEKV